MRFRSAASRGGTSSTCASPSGEPFGNFSCVFLFFVIYRILVQSTCSSDFNCTCSLFFPNSSFANPTLPPPPHRDFDPYDLRMKLPKAITRLAREHDPAKGTAYIHCTAGEGAGQSCVSVGHGSWGCC